MNKVQENLKQNKSECSPMAINKNYENNSFDWPTDVLGIFGPGYILRRTPEGRIKEIAERAKKYYKLKFADKFYKYMEQDFFHYRPQF